MKKNPMILTFLVLLFIISPSIHVYSEDGKSESEVENLSIKIGGQWFLSYFDGTIDGEPVNLFTLTRGYINVNTVLNESLSGRITPDVSIDQEGDGAGDLELRLKYVYLKWKIPDLYFFSKPYFELGLVHRPWLNFEENVNGYRVQGNMLLPRNGVISSADFGITFFTLLGGEMSDEYKKSVSNKYPGRYGSIAIGVYNGGGYHDFERNNNKPVEGRLTLRPLPDIIPGLQVSYTGAYGKGNTTAAPDWIMHMVYLSFEHRQFTLSCSYYSGVGDFRGASVDSLGNALDQDGYSVFAEYKIPKWKIGLIARFDFFQRHEISDPLQSRRYIAGISYSFYKKSKFLISYDRNEGKGIIGDNTDVLQFVCEVRF
jgi:hypothetical protein